MTTISVYDPTGVTQQEIASAVGADQVFMFPINESRSSGILDDYLANKSLFLEWGQVFVVVVNDLEGLSFFTSALRAVLNRGNGRVLAVSQIPLEPILAMSTPDEREQLQNLIDRGEVVFQKSFSLEIARLIIDNL